MLTVLDVTLDVGLSVHVGDLRAFVVQILDNGSPANISSATGLIFTFSKPSSRILTATPRFLTDGTDGKLTYTSVVGDIDEVGKWQLQATVTTPSAVFHSDITTFQVLSNLA